MFTVSRLGEVCHRQIVGRVSPLIFVRIEFCAPHGPRCRFINDASGQPFATTPAKHRTAITPTAYRHERLSE